jgi:gas vesicle protein
MSEFLQTILYAVITTCLPIIIGYVVSYLKAKRDKELQNIDSTYVKNTIKETTDTVISVVQTVAQTYVDDLKKAGRFTVEEQKIALSKAISQAKDLITIEAENVIVEKYSDLDAWIKTTIESYIQSTKK